LVKTGTGIEDIIMGQLAVGDTISTPPGIIIVLGSGGWSGDFTTLNQGLPYTIYRNGGNGSVDFVQCGKVDAVEVVTVINDYGTDQFALSEAKAVLLADLQIVDAVEGDMITTVSQSLTATYASTGGWKGDLAQIEAGEVYLYLRVDVGFIWTYNPS
jgi:hypothetical protein